MGLLVFLLLTAASVAIMIRILAGPFGGGKAVVDSIISAIKARPGDWSCDSYTMEDKLSGTRFWMANGTGYIRISTDKTDTCCNQGFVPGMLHQLRLMRAYRAWLAENHDDSERVILAALAKGTVRSNITVVSKGHD